MKEKRALLAQAAATVVVEEAEALFPALAEAIAAVEAVRGRIAAAREFMISATIPPAGKAVGRVTLPFERFDTGLNAACARPMPTASGPSEWISFALALSADASAALEG
jgi:hypothetical protein